MTYEEALMYWEDDLKNTQEAIESYPIEFKYAVEVKEALEIGIEALEKQIPKKPTDIKENEQFHCKIGHCSRCNDWVNDGMNVCDKCYQVIDWSEEE